MDHIQAARAAIGPLLHHVNPDEIVERLSKAGLLRTDLHEQALKALKEEAALHGHFGGSALDFGCPRYQKLLAVGREALALEKKPEPKWVAVQQGKYSEVNEGQSMRAVFYGPAHIYDSHVYAAQKNAEDRDKEAL